MLMSLVCVTLLFVTDFVVCKPDYLFNQEVNGWLKLHMVPATWQDAFLTCHYEGAVLASPINEQLATAVLEIMHNSAVNQPIYLGVQAFSYQDFISIEGVPLADLSITWGTYGDGTTPENCLTLSTDGNTYMSSCTLSLPFICYKKRDNTTILNECGTFDNDYQLYQATGSCYKYHKKPASWSLAHRICAAEGGYLVIINDKKEANVMTSFLDPPKSVQNWGSAAHIGLRDWDKDNTWLTIHGEKLETVYNQWAAGQPDHKGTYLCSIIWTRGYLDDIDCFVTENTFICEKDPNTSRFEPQLTALNENSESLQNSCCS